MKTQNGAPPQVRLTKENRVRLEKAQELGFVAGSFVNEIVSVYFDDYLQTKAQALQTALNKTLKHPAAR